MSLALAVILVILAAGSAGAADKAIIGGILGGIGGFGTQVGAAMEASRREALERERLRIEQQRLDQELAYQRAVLEQNQAQFDARMRRKTTLVLGWYLLMPPVSDPAQQDMRRWDLAASYDSAAACNAGRQEVAGLFADIILSKSPPSVEARDRVAGAIVASRCIASNDPRLVPDPPKGATK